MKIEKLSKGNSKIFLAGVVITLVLVVIINLFLSYSKYKLESSVDLAEGTINYTIPDLKLMAIYIKDDNGTFKEGTIQSNTTYQVVKDNTNNSSYCIDQTTGKKIDNVYMKFEDGNIDIKVNKKGTKCWVYLEKAKYLNEDILANNPPKESTYNATYKNLALFTSTSTIDEGIFSMPDYDGEPTYYFRGAVEDNYVHFANFYWRIIRINSNGSIRMIYDGTSTHANGEASQDRLSGRSEYNIPQNDAKYAGFMYGSAEIPTKNYVDANKNEIESNILKHLTNWYENNLLKYDNYIEKNAIFCNDRRSANYTTNYIDWLKAGSQNTGGYGTGLTYYSGNIKSKSAEGWYADLSCQINDRFTPKNATIGNKTTKYPIGILTSDEAVMAGSYKQANTQYYLYTGYTFLTMSLDQYDSYHNNAAMLNLSGATGTLIGGGTAGTTGTRAVINLKADTTFVKGDGSMKTPYEIE